MEEVGIVLVEGAAPPKWWSYLLKGLLAVAFGIILLAWPAATTRVLVVLFGIFVILFGLITVIGSILEAGAKEKFFWTLVLGILSVGLGVLAIAYPGLATVGILVIIAAWAIVSGFVLVVAAVEVSADKKVKWALGLTGALSLIVGIVLLVFPNLSVFGIIIIVAAYAIAHGILLVILSFWVREFYKKLAEG